MIDRLFLLVPLEIKTFFGPRTCKNIRVSDCLKKAERLQIALKIHTAPPRVAPLPLPARSPLPAGCPRVLEIAGEVTATGLGEPLVALASCLSIGESVNSLRCWCSARCLCSVRSANGISGDEEDICLVLADFCINF